MGLMLQEAAKCLWKKVPVAPHAHQHLPASALFQFGLIACHSDVAVPYCGLNMNFLNDQ